MGQTINVAKFNVKWTKSSHKKIFPPSQIIFRFEKKIVLNYMLFYNINETLMLFFLLYI